MGIKIWAENKKKRRNVAIAAVFLALLLLITGTYAWESLMQGTLGEMRGENGPVGARLHDDYEYFDNDDMSPDFNGKLWKNGITANKDIYVENYEGTESGREAFVRVKMYEFMDIGEGAREGPTLPGNTPNPDYHAQSLVTDADREDVTTWTPWQLGIGNEFSIFWSWSNGGQRVYMPTFHKDKEVDVSDITGAAKDYNESTNTTLYPTDAGLHGYWTAGETKTMLAELGDSVTDTETHEAKNTLDATVMTMAQWKAAGRNAGDFWVVDIDGWAYWANALAPQSATGLLLSDIYLKIEPEEDWFYAIHTRMQAASAGEWGDPGEGTGFYSEPGEEPSQDALYLLNQAAGYEPKVISVSFFAPVEIAYINTSLTLYPDVVAQYTNDPIDKKVMWDIEPATGTFTGGVFTPSAGDAGKWFTVTATSVLTPAVSGSIKVYVPLAGDTVVLNETNWELYKDMGQNCYSIIMPDGSVSPVVICAGLDEHPGTAADFGPAFDYNGKYYYQLGPNRYQGPGADLKLGTGDDDILYCTTPGDFSTLAPVTDQFIVHVSPATAEITKGENKAFTATVSLEGDPIDPKDVSWALVGSHISDTSLNTSTGGSVTLTVDAAETAISIILRVTQPASGGAIQGSYRDVPVTIKTPSPAYNVPVGGEFKDDKGVDWVVLKEGTGADSGYKLIITKYVYEVGTQYNNVSTWVPLEQASIRGVLNNFYVNKVGADVKNYAMTFSPRPLTDVRTAPGGFNANEMGSAGYSHPGSSKITGTGSSGVFILSLTEANAYFGVGTANDANRIANNFDDKTTGARWSLRSPGDPGTIQGIRVSEYGVMTASNCTGNGRGYRACVWIEG